MRTIKAIIVGVACLTAGAANAQWVVHDPGNLAQGIINTTKEIVETSATAQHTLDGSRRRRRYSSRDGSITMRSRRCMTW